ncbi:aldehyde dehydrogenase family protein [Parvularcula oceani]|uniref:aldehyde dehydrogenase family protein n=1 Tax=Parvularcula oceani TaxID=1247963 RepID=UPI0004E21CF8|nr:aldehyde dehydrogenase family protein [Parvularcula oceani]
MTWQVLNPFDQQPIGSVALVDWPQIDSWLDEADALHADLNARLPVHRRITILQRASALMRERAEALANQIAREGGKPIADARVETTRAIQSVELCVHELFASGGREIPMDLTEAGAGRKAFTFREPIGPVVAISAFNHPLNLIVHQVGPAVAAGCPVLVKPAKETPLSCRSFVEILYEAGLEERWCRFAPCEDDVAQRMVTDPRTAFFSFIGSARVGWMLRSKLAPGTRLALEHGGAAPVIVDEGVRRDAVIPALLKGGFYHSGQVCVSVQRVFVPQAELADFAAALGAGAEALIVGDPIQDETQCGPLIRATEVDRVEAWVDAAVEAGADVAAGGQRIGATLYPPTVLVDPPWDARVSREEVFGPVICVYGYDALDAAIDQANDLPYAFQAAVFADRSSIANRCVKALAASTVLVNDHTAFRVDWMPFAGRRQSGLGTGGIGYTMEDMTQEKLVIEKTLGTPA